MPTLFSTADMPFPKVNKALGRLVRSLVESSKSFVRWMDGSCIETPEQRGTSEDDEPIVFTFYWDVAANPTVIKMMLTLNQSIQRAISGEHHDSCPSSLQLSFDLCMARAPSWSTLC